MSNLSRRDDRPQPGVLTGFNPGIHVHYEPALPVRRSSGSMGRRRKRAAEDLFQISLGVRLSNNPALPPLQHPQPRGRGVQFGLGAVLQYSNTPSLRAAGFEDEDDDEDENEAPCEGVPFWGRYPGLKPRAESFHPFGIISTCPYDGTPITYHFSLLTCLPQTRILNRAQLRTLQRRYRISTIVGCIKGAGTMVA
jgi:hypothetical protein